MIRIILIFSMLCFMASQAVAKEKNKKVLYKSGKRIDFESLLIEGEKKKADYSVVTGNLGESDFGLLKFRSNFNDFMARDNHEVVKEDIQ